MCQKKPFYITTPIYYPSGNPHIGHCYTTVACDSIARYRRMQGYDVMFLTGTDEHGLKIEQKAAEKGVTPKEYVDEIVKTFKGLWKFMNISYDRYIRTTDDYHIETVQKIFKELYDKGYIYKGEYKGKYCTPCESFWTESQLIDGKCPECGREVTEAKEEAYFFKMSPFADRIEKLLTETDYLQPKTRAVELVNNFIKPGLEDLCVSRTSFKWGIPVTFDEKHIVYVWIDALSNYISALGYKNEKFDEFDKYWPADVHMVAKDIMRFTLSSGLQCLWLLTFRFQSILPFTAGLLSTDRRCQSHSAMLLIRLFSVSVTALTQSVTTLCVKWLSVQTAHSQTKL